LIITGKFPTGMRDQDAIELEIIIGGVTSRVRVMIDEGVLVPTGLIADIRKS
jgi:hypothetical protein